MKRRIGSWLALGLALVLVTSAAAQDASAAQQRLEAAIASVQQAGRAAPYDALFPPRTKVLSIETADGATTVIFSFELGQRPWSAEAAEELRRVVSEQLGDALVGDLVIQIQYGTGRRVMNSSLEDHITSPDAVRARELARTVPDPVLAAPVVERVDYAGPQVSNGLQGRNMVIAPSHGWTWHKDNRWQFQRARLHTTIEDLHPISYANPFLIPMLENAGAVVWPVRERDYQTAEVIVDNDEVTVKSRLELRGAWEAGAAAGWHGGVPAALGPADQPFARGTTLRAKVGTETASSAVYVPFIPRDGRYAVYVSWAADAENSPSVPVLVRHLGGETTVRVNQQVAGGTWVFLGFFQFAQGTDEANGSVTIATDGAQGGTWVTADAVRFGGGMGNTYVEGEVSNKPRLSEGARYWLQYSGAPADIIYYRPITAADHHFGPEYIRDYVARTEWTNWLRGAPWGPNNGWRDAKGLGVPTDLYLSWHTDAGVSHDGITGTHLIYSVNDAENNVTFPDERSRWLNRDLASLIEDEIVRTSRELYSSTWSRRTLHNRELSETTRANVPSALIELMSHQNLNDMKYGLDPRYKFDVSRAIYKAILRFTAWQHGYEPIVQPLPPTHASARHLGEGRVEIRWRAQGDPLEPTAEPNGYIVYAGPDGKAFDNGTAVDGDNTLIVNVPAEEARYFRITATNDGGESFPSPVVGVRWMPNAEPILIVDGFERVAPPAWIQTDNISGFDLDLDPGVGWDYHYGLVGDVYDYDKASPWQNDLEHPGWGASEDVFEDRLIPGNQFDTIARHGALLALAGHAFDSATAAAFADDVDGTWKLIDWAAGFQRTQPPHPGMPGEGNPDRMRPEFEVLGAAARTKLGTHLREGGKLLISGAYVAEDLIAGELANESSRGFARGALGIAAFESRATAVNAAEPAADAPMLGDAGVVRFGMDLAPTINLVDEVMRVHSAEAFEPAPGAAPVLVYSDSGRPAAVVSEGVLAIGFPLETVVPRPKREELMKKAVEALMQQ